MMRVMFFCLLTGPVWADSVVTTRPISAQSVITADDVTLVAMDIPGALTNVADAIGQSAVTAMNAGRPVLRDQIFSPLRVQRNAIVPLVVQLGGMEIRTEGRTLSEGNVGETIDIMNLSSRARIRGQLRDDGSVLVTAGN